MTCSCGTGGLTQILSLDVPGVDNSEGAATDVSGLVARKTVEIGGTYDGQYVILGSHDNVKYVPVLTFNSGSGIQSVKQTMCFTLRSLKVRRRAQNVDGPVTISVGSAATCHCG